MKRSDIPDGHVLDLARAWQCGQGPGAVEALVAEGWPRKLVVAKVEHMVRRGLLGVGVSVNYPWPEVST